MDEDFLFQVQTPLNFQVHCTKEYWNFIIENKHPALKGREGKIIETLSDPVEIRKSQKDDEVFLFYSQDDTRWVCAVTKQESDSEGFLITAYPTDAIKIGEIVWKK